ncbi:cytochrome P450 20A1-like isoform X2 [Anneissia japonica]|uniref:cytochrome P450 20A1-like isoform X1 n=1 Tax=Anneissia japonica TaxID=1529436 RepID=UPI001425AF39|nr:cytochrome P450 20A1-like isoform X1 [Anneissia japonica]XP_033112331.1 cytochrome P450 20A1-like isoform X2 [Anneissia japonica]
MMLAFVIFAVTFTISLILAVIYFYPGSTKYTTIPGASPSHPKDGNLADIGAAGSLHQYLKKLHNEHGPIVSFWFGQQMFVSLGSPELWRAHMKVFDRPPELFLLFEPLITKYSIQYQNKDEGRKRRKLTDNAFGHNMLGNFYSVFHDVVDELCQKISSLPDTEHIPVCQYMMALALKGITQTSFGDYFKDDEKAFEFRKHYDLCWYDLESRMSGDEPAPDSDRQKNFLKSRDFMHDTIRTIIKQRRNNPPVEDKQVFLDILIQADIPEEQLLADALTYVIGGLHTSGNALSWCLYFLATHKDVEEKLYTEFKEVLGDEKVTPETIGKLVYTRQVLDETMRTAVLAPTAARFQEMDVQIGGHIVPKMTPVIHALGVVQEDEKYWPEPRKFDPDRFSEENSKHRDKLAFSPFGFAGKRMCPGYRFSYVELTVFLSQLIRKFKFNLVEGLVIEPVHGLVTTPSDEIWVTVEKR